MFVNPQVDDGTRHIQTSRPIFVSLATWHESSSDGTNSPNNTNRLWYEKFRDGTNCPWYELRIVQERTNSPQSRPSLSVNQQYKYSRPMHDLDVAADLIYFEICVQPFHAHWIQ